MAHTTKYTCDVCKRPVSKMYGVLWVSLTSEIEKDVDVELELCSPACLQTYLKEKYG